MVECKEYFERINELKTALDYISKTEKIIVRNVLNIDEIIELTQTLRLKVIELIKENLYDAYDLNCINFQQKKED